LFSSLIPIAGLPGLHFEMKLHLFVEIALELAATKNELEPAEQIVHGFMLAAS
jgi:hypothetical protein